MSRTSSGRKSPATSCQPLDFPVSYRLWFLTPRNAELGITDITGFKPESVEFEVVGGRIKGKPIREDSDLDVLFRPSPTLRLAPGRDPIDQIENLNAFHEELNRALWKAIGTRLHILEARGTPVGTGKAKPIIPDLE